MALLHFNWRLGYVVAAASLWLLAGMLLALGAARPDQPPPVRLSLGPPPGGLWLPGELRAVEESAGLLTLTLALPPQVPREIRGEQGRPLKELPPGLEVNFVERRSAEPRETVPRIALQSGSSKPLKLPGGRALVLAENYVVKYGRGGVRVLKRTPELTRERIKRWLEREERQAPPEPERPLQKRWRKGPGGAEPPVEGNGPPAQDGTKPPRPPAKAEPPRPPDGHKPPQPPAGSPPPPPAGSSSPPGPPPEGTGRSGGQPPGRGY